MTVNWQPVTPKRKKNCSKSHPNIFIATEVVKEKKCFFYHMSNDTETSESIINKLIVSFLFQWNRRELRQLRIFSSTQTYRYFDVIASTASIRHRLSPVQNSFRHFQIFSFWLLLAKNDSVVAPVCCSLQSSRFSADWTLKTCAWQRGVYISQQSILQFLKHPYQRHIK